MEKNNLKRLFYLEQKNKNKEPMTEEEDREFKTLFKTRVNEFIREYR